MPGGGESTGLRRGKGFQVLGVCRDRPSWAGGVISGLESVIPRLAGVIPGLESVIPDLENVILDWAGVIPDLAGVIPVWKHSQVCALELQSEEIG